MMRRDEIIGLANCTSPSSSSTPSSSRCQDCGNQSKKDCLHRRCRTCCRGHAFHCPTHVKSTWIPVSRRRPRDRTMHQPHQITPSHHHQQLIQYGPNPSRPYGENPALGFQESNFPGETSLPATFRCVRVSSLDDEVDQYAYQTSVTIEGHTFTGILYDQGPAEPEGTVNYVTGESTSAGNNSTGLLQHHNIVTTNDTAGNNNPTQFLPFTIDSNISQFF